MIVSHQHRFIFTAVPKTGTHSVRQALREHLGTSDLEQVRLFVEKAFPFPALAQQKHGHIGLREIRPFVGEEAFSSYFKFAFVRNPFERYVSYCSFATSQQGDFDRDPVGVMRYFMFRQRPDQHLIFRPQHTFVTDADGRLLLDFVGRVEAMQASYDEICAAIGIPSSTLNRVNASRHADYRSYYDQQLVDAVAAYYKRDLDLFGYDF